MNAAGAALAPISQTGAAEAAANAAASAFAAWSHTPASTRADLLLKMVDQLEAARDALIDICAQETGASASWTAFNIELGKQTLRHAASLADALGDQTAVHPVTGTRSVIRRQAAGVVLSMVPWNAPIILAVRAVAGPLICGNTVVMKGSELCPQTHSLLVDVLNGAGLPDGVLNAVIHAPQDAQQVVSYLIGHPCVRRINFTGSTRVGRDVAIEAARHLKPVVLELSGKAPLIVLADADLDAAVEAACFGAFFNQGQICMSTEWIIVVDPIADAFVAKMQARMANLTAADPVTDTAPLGRMISADAARRVQGLIEDAVSKGAVLLAGGQVEADIMQPALLDGIASNMRVYHEETFGPLASVLRVHDADEAFSVANDSEFGLNAAVFSRDEAAATALADRLEYGIVQINGPTVHDDPTMPFGGMKGSGYGRFGGQSAIQEFTELRWIATHTTGTTPTL